MRSGSINSKVTPANTNDLQNQMVTGYGEFQLYGMEKLYVMLGPDFTVTEALNVKYNLHGWSYKFA